MNCYKSQNYINFFHLVVFVKLSFPPCVTSSPLSDHSIMHTAHPQQCSPLSCLISVSCPAVCPALEVNQLLVCLLSPLQLAPWSGPPSLCFPPPLSSSPGARPRWPACWPATLLRELRCAGRWTVRRWQRGSWAARRRRGADATAAAAPWAWAGSAGWKESCTPAGSSIMTTARLGPSAGAGVKPRGAGWGPGQELCVGGAGGTHCCSDQSEFECL